MKFEASGVTNNVLPFLDRGKASLNLATNIMAALDIPSDFSYFSTLRSTIPSDLANINTTYTKTKNWLNQKIDNVNNAERQNQQLINDLRSALIAIPDFSLLTNNNLMNNQPVLATPDMTAISISIMKEQTKARSANKPKSLFATIGSLADKALDKIVETGAEVFDKASNFIADGLNDLETSFKNTTAKISEKATSVFDKVGSWLSDCKEGLKKVGTKVADFAISTSASLFDLYISLTKGVCQFAETLVDLIIMLGTGVGSAFTGLYDAYQGINGAITGKEWTSATKEMWRGVMGIVAEDHVGNIVAEAYKKDPVLRYIDSKAIKAFRSDGVGCKVGSGIGYVAGLVALTVATAGVGSAAVGAAGASVGVSVSAATATAITSGVITGLTTFSSTTAKTWAGQRDKSWVGIERAYQNGDIDQETYNSYQEIYNMSETDWQKIEEAYNNGQVSQEDYQAMKDIRNIPRDWQTDENLTAGLKTGGVEGLKVAAITMVTMGIGGKISSGSKSLVGKVFSGKSSAGTDQIVSKLAGTTATEQAITEVAIAEQAITDIAGATGAKQVVTKVVSSAEKLTGDVVSSINKEAFKTTLNLGANMLTENDNSTSIGETFDKAYEKTGGTSGILINTVLSTVMGPIKISIGTEATNSAIKRGIKSSLKEVIKGLMG